MQAECRDEKLEFQVCGAKQAVAEFSSMEARSHRGRALSIERKFSRRIG